MLILNVRHERNTLIFSRKIKYSNFVPTDIFKQSKDGNQVFFKWSKFGDGYVVNDPIKQKQLIDLAGYRHFLFFYRPPILVLIITIAIAVASTLLYFTNLEIEIRDLVVGITIVMYICTLIVYFLKIEMILRGCEKITKEEKKWIWRNA